MYIEKLKEKASDASDRKMYHELVLNMKHLKEMPNVEPKFSNLLTEFREKYKRHLAMQDELNKL